MNKNNKIKISVIIPTYNRSNKLKKALGYLRDQSIDKKEYEIIIINDNSTDGTSKVVQEFIQKNKDVNLHFLNNKKEGGTSATARNIGVRKAVGQIVVMTGDDILCPKSFLKNHLKAHKVKDIAVIGDLIWTEKPNEFMTLLVDNASAKKDIAERNNEWSKFMTANVSIERKWLQQELFDEDFKFILEDTEVGLRLVKKRVRMVFDSSTKVYHNHYHDLKSFKERQKQTGKSIVIFTKKHPETKHIYVPKYMKMKRIVCKLLIESGIFQRVNPLFYAHLEDFMSIVEGITEQETKDIKSVALV